MSQKNFARNTQAILNALRDPAAVAKFLALASVLGLLKRATCNTRLGPIAGATVTVGEVGQYICLGEEIRQSLSGITFKSECSNAAPVIAKAIVQAIKTFGIAWLLRKITCFAAGTQVVIPASEDADPIHGPYTTKSIENIREGDLVLAWNNETGSLAFDRVTRTISGACDHLRLVTFEDEGGRRQTLRTTDQHPFWSATSQEWVCAAELERDTMCQGSNGEQLSVFSSLREEHANGVLVYNFTVDKSHTYFVKETTDSVTALLVSRQRVIDRFREPCVRLDCRWKIWENVGGRV